MAASNPSSECDGSRETRQTVARVPLTDTKLEPTVNQLTLESTHLEFVLDMYQRLAIAGANFAKLASLVAANVVPLAMAVVLFKSKVDTKSSPWTSFSGRWGAKTEHKGPR